MAQPDRRRAATDLTSTESVTDQSLVTRWPGLLRIEGVTSPRLVQESKVFGLSGAASAQTIGVSSAGIARAHFRRAPLGTIKP